MLCDTLLIFIFISVSCRINLISALEDCRIVADEFKHDYLRIKKPVYDIGEFTKYQYYTYDNIKNVEILEPYQYAMVSLQPNNNFEINLQQINEKMEPTKSQFFYNFTITLTCGNDVEQKSRNVHVIVPVIDTNNHKPFFDKPLYTYNLISTYPQDFIRLQEINPITATDYDITNQKLVFSIEANQYFDMQYNGIVPDTLNKKHFAKLVPKKQTTLINQPISLEITVTDSGYPPHTNTSKVVINPPSPPTPVFNKACYVGHYYKNGSFIINENPELLQGVTFYKTTIDVIHVRERHLYRFEQNYYFVAIINDGIIEIERGYELSGFYEQNYSAHTLEAHYTDEETGLSSTGRSILIVELHHDL